MPLVSVQGAADNYHIRLENGQTTMVLGLIQSTATKGRPTPPQPANGFDTSYTPFGNGHVFALSLGGTDDARNIVPQWEQWQQTGTWRQVEKACEALNGKIFLAQIVYDPTAPDARDMLQLEFQTDAFVHWSDKRIPLQFQVRVYSEADVAYPSTLASDQAFDAFVGAITAVPLYDSGPLAHAAMPSEDKAYWQKQRKIGAAQQCHAAFEQKTGQSIDFVDYLMRPTSLLEIRDKLRSGTGFSSTEVNGVTMPGIFDVTLTMPKTALRKLKADYARDVQRAQVATAKRKDAARAAAQARTRANRQARLMQRRLQAAASSAGN